MELDRQPNSRVLRLNEDGSAVIEGIGAIVVGVLLLAVVVQVSLALMARATAQGMVDAAARHAARPGADLSAVAAELSSRINSGVPDASAVATSVTAETETQLRALARFTWAPPGPFVGHLTIAVDATAARLVPP